MRVAKGVYSLVLAAFAFFEQIPSNALSEDIADIYINDRSQASLDVGARASARLSRASDRLGQGPSPNVALDSEGRFASLLRHVITSPARPEGATAIYTDVNDDNSTPTLECIRAITTSFVPEPFEFPYRKTNNLIECISPYTAGEFTLDYIHPKINSEYFNYTVGKSELCNLRKDKPVGKTQQTRIECDILKTPVDQFVISNYTKHNTTNVVSSVSVAVVEGHPELSNYVSLSFDYVLGAICGVPAAFLLGALFLFKPIKSLYVATKNVISQVHTITPVLHFQVTDEVASMRNQISDLKNEIAALQSWCMANTDYYPVNSTFMINERAAYEECARIARNLPCRCEARFPQKLFEEREKEYEAFLKEIVKPLIDYGEEHEMMAKKGLNLQTSTKKCSMTLTNKCEDNDLGDEMEFLMNDPIVVETLPVIPSMCTKTVGLQNFVDAPALRKLKVRSYPTNNCRNIPKPLCRHVSEFTVTKDQKIIKQCRTCKKVFKMAPKEKRQIIAAMLVAKMTAQKNKSVPVQSVPKDVIEMPQSEIQELLSTKSNIQNLPENSCEWSVV